MSAGYEKSDVKILSVVKIAMFSFFAVAFVMCNGCSNAEKERVAYDEVLKKPTMSLEELRAKENKVLTSYQLTDSAKQVYSIPIDKAMELYLNEYSQTK